MGYSQSPDGTTTQALIETMIGRVWSITPSPNASGKVLLGVSCSSATNCVAVGDYHDSGLTLIELWNGNTWSISSSPTPSGVNTSVLWGVSCVSGTYCVGTGADNDSANWLSLIETWDGSTWSISPSPSPSISYNILRSVSCISSSFCVAVGEYWDSTQRGTITGLSSYSMGGYALMQILRPERSVKWRFLR